MSKISIVAAVADNYAIGKSNKLPWYLPADLKHFKEITIGHTVLMGKRTFESLPNGPLPYRKNIVLTSMLSDGVEEGYYESDSIEDALQLCENECHIFIIGGGAVYKQTMDIANSLYITWVHADFQADAFFPSIDFNVWKETERQDFEPDEKNLFAYSFVKYEKI
ncbi:MAG: diacylglycerol kinase [Porphyromonadaceae bacterium CG2_30_38_12]|nr:MAG: diacylglycerol kinase [Porphyromonadaceae bacterium CG2_30_38_12]